MFLRAGELIRCQEVLNFRLAIDEALGVDLLKHSRSTCNDVTSILLDGSIGGEVDIIFHQRDGGLQRISDMQPSFDPLHFLCCSHIVNWAGI